MDVDSIEAGTDFVTALTEKLNSCEVCVAVVGPRWRDMKDVNGRRRLDDPCDFVRVELASALRRNIKVIPLLVEGALPLREEALPDDLKPLARRQAVTIRHERFGADVEDLIAVLKERKRRTGAPTATQLRASSWPRERDVEAMAESYATIKGLYLQGAFTAGQRDNIRERALVPPDAYLIAIADFTTLKNGRNGAAVADQGVFVANWKRRVFSVTFDQIVDSPARPIAGEQMEIGGHRTGIVVDIDRAGVADFLNHLAQVMTQKDRQ